MESLQAIGAGDAGAVVEGCESGNLRRNRMQEWGFLPLLPRLDLLLLLPLIL